jgi:thiol-disulfide isomerase/thioredoxin
MLTRAHAAPLLVAFTLTLAALAAGAGDRIAIEDLQGRRHAVPDPQQKAIVLFFIASDCPISNAFAPEINRICDEYGPRKVVFYMVYVEPNLPLKAARKHAKEYAFRCPALIDRSHRLVRVAGATITPEAAVLGGDGRVLYRGRIDDRFADLGTARPAPTSRDLRQALDAVLEDRPVPNPTTKAIGCYIPEVR